MIPTHTLIQGGLTLFGIGCLALVSYRPAWPRIGHWAATVLLGALLTTAYWWGWAATERATRDSLLRDLMEWDWMYGDYRPEQNRADVAAYEFLRRDAEARLKVLRGEKHVDWREAMLAAAIYQARKGADDAR